MPTASTASTASTGVAVTAAASTCSGTERVLGDPPARALVLATIAVSIAGAMAEIGAYVLGWPDRWAETLSLGFEANVPTWYASSLLALCAAALAECASRA